MFAFFNSITVSETLNLIIHRLLPRKILYKKENLASNMDLEYQIGNEHFVKDGIFYTSPEEDLRERNIAIQTVMLVSIKR
jgi:hypothetical protein